MTKIARRFLLRHNLDKFRNQRVLVRVDLNVDLVKGKIFDRYRIETIKQTLKALKIARSITLLSHWGQPTTKDRKWSLKRLLPEISAILKEPIGFQPDVEAESISRVTLLENLRFSRGETKNSLNFAKKLAKLGDVYINEAFSASHRQHASIVALPRLLPSYFGLNFEQEIERLNRVIQPKRPLILILGGAKISTKLPLIQKFLHRADLIILAGGLAITYLKAKGFEVGRSLVETEVLKKVHKIKSAKLLTPFDFVLKNKKVVSLGELKPTDVILDIGPDSLHVFFEEIKQGQTIVWNGPLGYIEDKNFERGTKQLAEFLAKLKSYVMAGGGDTLAFIEQHKLQGKFNYLSTGGGAMLEYLAQGTLPGIKVIVKPRKVTI